MPSIEELKQFVEVEDDLTDQQMPGSENLNDYIHRKLPCKVKFDVTKEQYYDSVRSSMKNLENIDLGSDLKFSETLPNGKLAIFNDDDSEDEEKDTDLFNSINRESILLGNKFCKKYNLRLSFAEKESNSKSDVIKAIRLKKRKIQLARNDKGQFVKGSTVPVNGIVDDKDFLSKTDFSFHTSTQISLAEETRTDIRKITKDESHLYKSIDINDTTFDDSDIESDFSNLDDYFNLSEISLFSDHNDIVASETSKKANIANDKDQFFRPFKHYWMHHCIFSRVKPKNFAVFERTLPRNFRWLLNECALVVEMSTKDLYEEVCLIETYHAHITKSSNSKSGDRSSTDRISRNQIKRILNMW